MSVVILPCVRVERDGAEQPRTTFAKVLQFNPRIALCAVCGSSQHRASKCPARPGPARDQLQIEG